MKIRIVFFGYRSSLGKAIEKVWFYEKYEKQGSGCEPGASALKGDEKTTRMQLILDRWGG